MQKLSRIAAAAMVFVCVPAGVLMAQSTPTTGPETTTTPAPTPAPAAPAATAPAATATAPAATAPAATAPATTTTEPTTKKKKSAKMTRQQEIDKSIDSGTVPSRYRKSVPKEYQHYIPFAK
jgi:hypothetical protein